MSGSDTPTEGASGTWGAGDYSQIASRLVPVSEHLCEAVDLRAGRTVLDVASGHGNTTLAAARHGAVVTAIDITEPLLEQGRDRARAEHLAIDFRLGDMEAMPFADGEFDFVLSTFGAMFAGDPERMARQLVRVGRQGAVIGLATWSSAGANAAEGAAVSSVVGGDGEPESPWASESGLHGLFTALATAVEMTERTVPYRFPTIAAYVDTAMTRFGPFMKLADSLSDDRRTMLRSALISALEPFNESGDDTMVIRFPYLETVVRL